MKKYYCRKCGFIYYEQDKSVIRAWCHNCHILMSEIKQEMTKEEDAKVIQPN